MAEQVPLPSKMNALIKESPEVGFTLKSVPIPEPGDQDLLLRIVFSSLCGSDINLYNWNETAQKVACIPFITGHEAVGVVVATGKEVDSKFQIGCRVAVENHFYCGECFQCCRGEYHICQKLRQYGHGKLNKEGVPNYYTLATGNKVNAVSRIVIRYLEGSIIFSLSTTKQVISWYFD